nr:type II toxin-antitoxin system YoeB family toxin [Pseudoalteromonas sp. PPB1]
MTICIDKLRTRKRINNLINDIKRPSFDEGIGEPEPLRES